LAQLCEQIENDKIEKVKSEDMISTLKQLNNRHKHLIDIQRNDLKEKQLEFQELVYNKGKE
jgi:hypothetical protein